MKYLRLIFTIALCLMFAACSTSNVKPKPAQPTVPAATPKPVAPPATPEKGRGGYYLDDGPGDNPPVNIDSIPDAVPRPEALSPRANSPYTVFGKNYVPMQSYIPFKDKGIASWYGKRFHGKKTSNGEIYDMYGMTGAHPTLPIPSYLRVTNPENGRSVIIRINDRGPFHSNRLTDLSYAAAYKLGLINKGSGLVEIEAIDNRAETLTKSGTDREPPDAPPVNVKQPTVASTSLLAVASSAATAADSASTAMAAGSYVQVGAFKHENNAQNLRQQLIQQNLSNDGASGSVAVTSWYNEGVYRVRLGPYSNRSEATAAAARIKQVLNAKAIVINQD